MAVAFASACSVFKSTTPNPTSISMIRLPPPPAPAAPLAAFAAALASLRCCASMLRIAALTLYASGLASASMCSVSESDAESESDASSSSSSSTCSMSKSSAGRVFIASLSVSLAACILGMNALSLANSAEGGLGSLLKSGLARGAPTPMGPLAPLSPFFTGDATLEGEAASDPPASRMRPGWAASASLCSTARSSRLRAVAWEPLMLGETRRLCGVRRRNEQISGRQQPPSGEKANRKLGLGDIGG